MNPDGSEQVNITRNKADDISPRWSPTGEQILFVSDRDGVRDLYLMDANGTNVRRIFGKSMRREKPTWSPTGEQIAYKRGRFGGRFIYIAPIDGKKEERVAIGSCPTWSSDGTEIAFLTGWPDRMQISLFNVETQKQRILFPKEAVPSWMTSPTWSPTGDQIAFSWLHRVPLGKFLDTETIYILNRHSPEKPVRIVDEAGPQATEPVWAPTGKAILYAQADDVQAAIPSRSQIFKITLGGEAPVQLTHGGLWHNPGDWFDPAYALPVSPQPQLLTTQWAEMKKAQTSSEQDKRK